MQEFADAKAARQERKPLSDDLAMTLVSEVMQETGVTFTGNGVYCAVQIAKRAHGITQEPQ